MVNRFGPPFDRKFWKSALCWAYHSLMVVLLDIKLNWLYWRLHRLARHRHELTRRIWKLSEEGSWSKRSK